MSNLPDPRITLREARDFVFSSLLGRLALDVTVWPQWPRVLHDLIEVVHHLVQSCHMPEFTDHGLPHICSLVDRVSLWESPGGRQLVQQLTHRKVASCSSRSSSTISECSRNNRPTCRTIPHSGRPEIKRSISPTGFDGLMSSDSTGSHRGYSRTSTMWPS